MIVGTSMQVYPAAGLINYKKRNTPIYFIDPKPSMSKKTMEGVEIIAERATVGVPIAVEHLSRI